MDWLKDKKNQPYVAAGAAAIIVIVGVVIFMMTRGGSSTAEAPVPGGEMSTPAGGGPPMPPMPGMPGTPPGAGAPAPGATPAGPVAAAAATPSGKPGQREAKVTPMLNYRKDPFLPVGYKPPKIKKKQPPPIVDFPFISLPHPGRDDEAKNAPPEEPQPTRRMAGLLLNGRIFAIIETNGKSEIVQPGDMLSDRLARVERIERDKVVLKTTTGKNPRRLIIRMAAAPQTDTGGGGAEVGPTRPMGPGMPGMPGMPMPPMPGMPGGRRPM